MSVGVSISAPVTATLEARAADVRGLVQEGEIDLAVRRLLDLARDFAPSRELRIETVSLSAKHNQLNTELRKYGPSNDLTRNRDLITNRILELTYLLEDAATSDQQPSSQTSSGGSAMLSSNPTSLATSPTAAAGDAPSSLAIAKREFLARERKLLQTRATQTAVCRCNALGKAYRRGATAFALHDVTLELKVGRITGVMAANGHGKTTLLRLIAGELLHTDGSLEYPLLIPDGGLDWRRIKREVAYVPQTDASWGLVSLETSLRATAAAFGRTGVANDDEVECDCSREDLARLCARFGQIDVTRVGTAFLLSVPVTTSGRDLLSLLIASNVQVRYFRDISTSTRTMLRMER